MSKGVLVLTEKRSGSSWLGSLARSTGRLGNSAEWFADHPYGAAAAQFDGATYISRALERAATPNGFFYIKLFPKHYERFIERFGVDLITYFVSHHDVTLIRLTRRDTVKQAVSFARALQTDRWNSNQEGRGVEKYDFDLIRRCFWSVKRSDMFWDSLLELQALESARFVYEDLVAEPTQFVQHIADHAGIGQLPDLAAKTRQQSDERTAEWVARFRAEVAKEPLVPSPSRSEALRISLSNLNRALRGRHLRPTSRGS